VVHLWAAEHDGPGQAADELANERKVPDVRAEAPDVRAFATEGHFHFVERLRENGKVQGPDVEGTTDRKLLDVALQNLRRERHRVRVVEPNEQNLLLRHISGA